MFGCGGWVAAKGVKTGIVGDFRTAMCKGRKVLDIPELVGPRGSQPSRSPSFHSPLISTQEFRFRRPPFPPSASETHWRFGSVLFGALFPRPRSAQTYAFLDSSWRILGVLLIHSPSLDSLPLLYIMRITYDGGLKLIPFYWCSLLCKFFRFLVNHTQEKKESSLKNMPS